MADGANGAELVRGVELRPGVTDIELQAAEAAQRNGLGATGLADEILRRSPASGSTGDVRPVVSGPHTDPAILAEKLGSGDPLVNGLNKLTEAADINQFVNQYYAKDPELLKAGLDRLPHIRDNPELRARWESAIAMKESNLLRRDMATTAPERGRRLSPRARSAMAGAAALFLGPVIAKISEE